MDRTHERCHGRLPAIGFERQYIAALSPDNNSADQLVSGTVSDTHRVVGFTSTADVGSSCHTETASRYQELQAVRTSILSVAPTVRFSDFPDICSSPQGSNAFADGQVERQVTPVSG